MAATDATSKLVQSVVTATSSLEPFPVLQFMQRLYDKARQTGNAAAFKTQLPLETQYGPDDGLLINNVDETARLSKLATQCIVKAVSSLDDGTDKSGFRACVQGAPAIQDTDSDILSLTTLLFSEHINWHLAANKDAQGKAAPVANLDQLNKTAGFADAFVKEITGDKFVTGEVYQDLANGNHIFSMALLFIAQYLHDGPGFTALSTSAFQTSVARTVLTEWASGLVKVPQADYSKVFSFITHVASGVLLPDSTVTPLKATLGAPGPQVLRLTNQNVGVVISAALAAAPPTVIKTFPVGALSRTVLDTVFQPATKALAAAGSGDRQSQLASLTESDIVEYQSIAAANQAQWDGMADRWLKGVSTVANAQTQSTRTENDDFGHGFAEGLSFGIAGGSDIYITTVTGQGLADWMTSVRAANPTLFTSSTPNTVSVNHQKTTPAGNCFIAGTKVATDQGEVNIEEVTEGTRVLTEATTGRYGVASDEDVTTPPVDEKIPLVGFNNEGVFASLGHIFLTTTGPRALEPGYAMQENSFADVGRLRQGHALYRLSKDGKSYDVVPIESIQVSFVPAVHLHGVHLREGDRSYHANGYQVALNYPEITVKSIAKALSQLPRHQAVKALQQISELAPVFKKIGVPGVSALLRQELKDARRNKFAPPLGSVKRKHHHRRYQGLNFKDLRRTWALTAKDSPLTDKNGPAGYKLPLVSVQEGVLHLDHDIVPRVAFDTKGLSLRWSRALKGGQGHEHGVINFTDHGLLGQGAVYVSDDENPSELPDKLDTVVPFTAKKATSADVHAAGHGQAQPAGVQKPSSAPAAPAAAPTPAATPAPAAASAPAPAAAPAPATTGITAAAPVSHVAVGAPVAAPTPTKTTTTTTTAAAAASPLADPGTIDQEDFYDVVVDTATWPTNTTKTAPTTPVSMGQVALATYHSNGKTGLSVPVIVVPTLDTLLADINKTRSATSQLAPLYHSTVLVNKTGTLTGTVTFDSAATVALLSDQAPKDENAALPVKNLTFTAFKSTVKIPVLYQSTELSFSWDFNDISGAVYEFDPSTVGNTGMRHWFGTSTAPAPVSLARAAFSVKAATAKTTAHTTATGAAVPSGTHVGPTVAAVTAKPALVTRVLAAAQPLTIQGIASIPGYSEDSVHKQSQTLLQNMMYYHMNESDRTTFLNYPKPTNLPTSLADGLDTTLKTWIQNTYAPAYISFMLSQVAPGESKAWRVNFDQTENDKIWYWWSGSGKNCLSKQTQYNTLNELTSRQAMLDLYGTTINPYLPQGQTWAAQLFTGWTGTHAMNALLQQPINDANVNLLNMYCNILHALYPTTGAGGGVGEYSDQLFQAVLAHATAVQSDNTATFNDATGEAGRTWLYDAMHTLIVATLSNDPSLDPTVRNDLLADMNNLASQMGIADNAEATEKANIMLGQLNGLIANMAGWMTKIGKGLSALWGLSGFSLAGTVFDRAATAVKDISPGKIALAKGCSILALTAVYTFAAVNSFMQWDTLGTTGKTSAILITLKMVTDVAQKSFEAWAEYKKPPTAGSTRPSPTATAAGRQMDQTLQAEMSGDQGKETTLNLGSADSGKPPSIPDIIDQASANATTTNKIGADDIGDGTAKEKFDQPIPAEGPGGETAWSRFNTPANWLKAVGIAISVALVIVMSVSLAQSWNSLNDAGKALSTIQIITTSLSIAVDVAVFAGEMAAMETCLFVTVLPIVGAVLAIIGLVVCVLMMVLGITKKQDPPPTPVETFITNTKATIDKWDPMPAPALTYTVPLSVKSSGTAAPYTILAANDTAADVTRTSVRVTLQGGSDPGCLFSDAAMADQGVVAGGVKAASTLKDGQVGALAVDAGPPAAELAEALTATQRGDTITSWDAVVQGVVDATANPAGNLVLKGGKKQGFAVSFCGKVNAVGQTVNTSFVQVVEVLTNGDSCRALFTVTRS